MKNISLFLILFIGLLACEENKPIVPCLSCADGGTAIDPSTVVKKVLLEEFTGVRCVNCPQAQAEIKNLQTDNLFGEDLIAVSYHAGFFARPYSTSEIDFRTQAGTDILNFLETPIGYPSGVINRTQFDGESSAQLIQYATWGGFVGQALAEDARIAIDLSATYTSANRQLDISIATTALDNIAEALNITVLITENGLTDIQLTPEGEVDNYEQIHTFRTMLTGTFGDALATSLSTSERIDNEYSFNLPSDWVAENCSVVAFVHQATEGKEVLQVAEVKIVK